MGEQEEVLQVEDGQYAYKFRKVPPGNYYLVAGTDMDQDNYICDAGEACGAFPTASEPELIQVKGNTGGVKFSVGFDASFNSLTEVLGYKQDRGAKGYRRLQHQAPSVQSGHRRQ